MKRVYLLLSVLGFLAPLYPMLKVSLETGNILLWTNPDATIAGLFGNDISTAFGIDLLYAVLVFFVWVFADSRRLGLKRAWIVVPLTLLFGIAGPLPLYLYLREKRATALAV